MKCADNLLLLQSVVINTLAIYFVYWFDLGGGHTLTNCDKYDEGAPDRRRQSRKTELSFAPATGFDASIIFARSSHWRRKTVTSKSKESMMRYLSIHAHGCGGFVTDIELTPRDWM